jgi:predicted Co/Zn/Cd cation transporter (cation efflux family)
MTLDATSAYQEEMRVLRLSMYTALVMAIVGIGFAFAANSQVILLDGLFNVILFVMVAFGISISRRINQGPDKHYHFGYGGYEPFLILVRASLGLALMIFAAFGAVQTILRGGSPVNGNLALVYSIILGLGCGTVATIMHRAYKKTGWPTIYSEFITWLLNGVISGSSGVALFAVGLLRGTSLEWVVPYADPVILLLMSLVLLPPPLGLLKQSVLEIVGRAPDQELASEKELIGMIPEGFSLRVARVIRVGRAELIATRIACDGKVTVDECDALRRRWLAVAERKHPNAFAVMVFSNEENAM